MSFNEIYTRWKSDNNSVSKTELDYLYNKAKDAYYNGDELISDAEFDEIEKQLGKENKGYIGSKTGNYTVKHSFIMGSIAKSQVKEDKKTGIVNWDIAADTITKALNKANDCTFYETTPKLDGCSFSAEFKNVNNEAILISCATRGDGEYGSDISHWFESTVKGPYWNKIDEAVSALCRNMSNDIFCVRGEILIPYSSFNEKYQEIFTNPRSFVAGCTTNKWENTKQQKEYASNLHFVCYDYRIVNGDNGEYTELDWINSADPTYSKISKYLGHIGELPDMDYCQVHAFNDNISIEELQDIYNVYDDYRNNISKYALDGVVFKPTVSARKYNENRKRPLDCIAMKFMPMMNATKIIDIKWTVGKTGEYTPIAIIDTIQLDGKNIHKASLHNYNYIVKHGAGIGSKVRISLAGDIIPFVYEIIEPAGCDNINLPTDSYIETDSVSANMHLMKKFDDMSLAKNKFLASAKSLNINYIGPATAETLWDELHDIIPNVISIQSKTLDNIIQLLPSKTHDTIYEVLGNSKSIENIVNSLDDYMSKIELSDIIKSFCFKMCGDRASILCAKLLSGIDASTSGFPAESYMWVYDKNSDNYKQLMNALDILNLGLDTIEVEEEDNSDKIPIIMTGSPKNITSYATKEEFLNNNPKYVETTSWKECKLLVTDDITSTSGKMKKALKAGIKIMSYDEADNA